MEWLKNTLDAQGVSRSRLKGKVLSNNVQYQQHSGRCFKLNGACSELQLGRTSTRRLLGLLKCTSVSLVTGWLTNRSIFPCSH